MQHMYNYIFSFFFVYFVFAWFSSAYVNFTTKETTKKTIHSGTRIGKSKYEY